MPGVQSPLAFGLLIERLRLHGFANGTADCLRLQDLLERMAGQCAPGDLKTLLCPIFARSREQQRIFYEVFDEFWRQAQLVGPVEPPAIGLPPAAEWEGKQRRLRIRRLSAKMLAALLALVLLLAGFVIHQWLQTPPAGFPVPAAVKINLTPPPAPPAPPETTRITHEGIVTRSRFAGPLRTAAALGVIAPLVWLAFFLWIRRSDRKEAEEVVRHYKPPYWWDVRPKMTPLECYRTEKFYTAARKLRLRLASGRQVLDLGATILATAKQRGYPGPRYRTVTRPADYLCLIRRDSSEDHRAALFDTLVSGLATEDVAVHRYFFQADASLCTNPAGDRTWTLAELLRKFPVSAVLVFGDTLDLFHPVRGDLLAWAEPDEAGPVRALFTSGRPSPRQARLAAKAETGIFPATVEGLLAFAEMMAIGAKPTVEYIRSAPYTAEKPIPETPAELRTFLGRDAYALLCACAAYPKLDWNLTLYLGAALPGGRESLTEQALTRLVQLPWFQSGGLPERLRTALLRDLDAEQTSAVQSALADLLEHDRPAEGTFAAAARELQLAVFKAHGGGGAGPVRRLLGTLRLMPLDEVAPDTTLLQFLDLTVPNRRVAVLPRKLRERLFRRGVPGLGWTTASWILGAALAASVAAGFFFGLPPDTSIRMVIAGRCVDSKGAPARPTEVHLASQLAETPFFDWNNGFFVLRVRPAKHGPLTVNFQGPKGTTVTENAEGETVFWNVEFPEPATANQPDESANLLVNQAIAEYNRGNYANAVQFYAKALALDPNNGLTLDLMAYSNFKLKRYDQAIGELNKALGLGYDYALLDMARVECAKGDFAAANLDLQNPKINAFGDIISKDGELLRLCAPVAPVFRGNQPAGAPPPAINKALISDPGDRTVVINAPSGDASAALLKGILTKAGFHLVDAGRDSDLPAVGQIIYHDQADQQYAYEIQKLAAEVRIPLTPIRSDISFSYDVIELWIPAPGAPAPAPTGGAPTLPPATLLSQLQDVYFDYDKSDIRPDARIALAQDAAILKKACAQTPRPKVVIEGQTDERGTAEYNLGLGDHRAASVKDYLVQLGVPADCLVEISYGKERPVCTDATAACWQKNSRVHFSLGQ